MSDDPAFIAFAGSGAWPGFPTKLASELAGAGIATRDDVSTSALAALPGISILRAPKLLDTFVAAAPALDLVEVLLRAGVEVRLAARAADVLGRNLMRTLGDDPWALLAVPTVDPDTADRVARALVEGVRRDDVRRGRALVAHVVAVETRSGHTLMPRDDVLDALGPFGVGDPEAAVAAAVEAGLVREVGDDLSPAVLADAEAVVSESIARLVAVAEPFAFDPRRPAVARLDETQRGAVAAAMAHGVSVLTGGPGTGKSATVAAIVDQCAAAGVDIALAAPTGRAAKRLEELTDAEAATIHRLLGAQISGGQGRPRGEDEESAALGGRRERGTWSMEFDRGEDWPLDQEVVVVDEASMLDTELAAALLVALADGSHLVVVGDPAQLPSVGPGQVLADLLEAVAGREDIPTTELTTLYRQAEGGAIARLATAVRGGDLPAVEPTPDHEVVLVAAKGGGEAAHRVVQLVTDSIPRALGIASDVVQVVTPVHGGPAGTVALNNALKAVLNPGDRGSKQRFDPGDRVVATANHLEAEPNGYANGEVGTVSAVKNGTVTVEFSSGPANVRGRALTDLAHGWAVTVHRAQGSEFPAVVVVLPSEAMRMLSRPLVYTALTRAQRHLSIVHAAGPAVARAVRQVGVQRRRTGLADRLRTELDEV
ncbi:AAA family ATPase [Jatrophihabitans sp. YIM 134969]